MRLQSDIETGRSSRIWGEWRSVAGVALITLAVILGWHWDKYGSLYVGGQELIAGVFALGLVVAITGFSLVLRHGTWIPMDPMISSLGTTCLRLLTILLALGLATATKWNAGNSFASHLLGCYFIFLVLESCLSVRWYSSRSSDLPS